MANFDRAAALAYVQANTTHHVRAVIADLIAAGVPMTTEQAEREHDDGWITIVDQNGNEVGGSGVLGVWVQKQ